MVKQGDIYMVDLSPVKGHEQGGKRPVLIMQNNILNDALSTVFVIPLTSNLKRKGLLTTVSLPKKKTGLSKDSVGLLYQIKTIDKARLGKKIGSIPKDDFMILRQRFIRLIY